jgi:hypothetical protein
MENHTVGQSDRTLTSNQHSRIEFSTCKNLGTHEFNAWTQVVLHSLGVPNICEIIVLSRKLSQEKGALIDRNAVTAEFGSIRIERHQRRDRWVNPLVRGRKPNPQV